MARLSKVVREWTEVIGISPSAIAEAISELTDDVRDIVVEKVDETINEQLSQGGHSRSLAGYYAYTVRGTKKRINIGGESFEIQGYRVYTQQPDWHTANVFDLIDAGRPQLPKREKPYTIWSSAGYQRKGTDNTAQPLNFPASRSLSNLRQQQTGASFTPIRNEPRSWGQRVENPPPQFFSRGPLRAVPPRHLYKRIMTKIRRELSRRDLPFEGVEFSGDE